MKTIKSYSEAIRNQYLRDYESGHLRGEIYKLTPANIRKLCLNLICEDITASDKTVLKNIFETNDFDNLRSNIKKYDIDKFKPICKFLKKENESIASHEALELIATFIKFDSRPYSKFRNEEKDINQDKHRVSSDTEIDDRREIINIKPNNNKSFAWFSNTSVRNKILLFLALTVITVTAIFALKDQTRWMVWQKDHYIEVDFDTEKYKLNQLKIYKGDRIKLFKKINPELGKTIFFNKDGSVNIWYGKNRNKELEYFTALGLHPETGKTLKPITQYMIDKYLSD